MLNGSQIVAERWYVGSKEHLLIYLYDASGSPIGMKYWETDCFDFSLYFFEKNLQGDIVGIFNDDGVKIGSYTYDAWGNHTYSIVSGTTSLERKIVTTYNPFRYRGYYYDTETQWYYLQSRYYNPSWGRFINADIIIGSGGFAGFNLFVYCANNPIMFCDPCGTCVHNGVAEGMGRDCDDCMFGRTDPEYDKIPQRIDTTPESDFDWEQYYIEKIQNDVSLDGDRATSPSPSIISSAEITLADSKYSQAQSIVSTSLNVFSLALQAIGKNFQLGEAMGVSGVGYMITTPISITMHWANPNLSNTEKGIMTGYEIAVAGGGILWTYAVINCWNFTGWYAFGMAVVYTGATYIIGMGLQNGFENN